jgi:hypothetical protein
MTLATLAQDRTNNLYRTLDLIRCGDGTEDTLAQLPSLAGCWDGIADLAADPGYTHGDPMSPGTLRTLVEDIWECQRQLDLTDDALRDLYLDIDNIRLDWAGCEQVREEQHGNAIRAVNLILIEHDDANLRAHIARYGLIAHCFPTLHLVGAR